MLLEGSICRSELLGKKSFKEGQPIKTLAEWRKANQPTNEKGYFERQKQKKNKNKKQLIELFLECFACQWQGIKKKLNWQTLPFTHRGEMNK